MSEICIVCEKRDDYILNAICDVLDISLESFVPKTIELFSKNVLQNEKSTIDLVKKYDEVGPKLAEAIVLDGDKKFIESLYNGYLMPVSELIVSQDAKSAIDLYKNMVSSLIDYYCIDVESDKSHDSFEHVNKIYQMSKMGKLLNIK